MQVFAAQQADLIEQLHILFAGHCRQIEQLGIIGHTFIQCLGHSLQNRHLMPDREYIGECLIIVWRLFRHP